MTLTPQELAKIQHDVNRTEAFLGSLNVAQAYADGHLVEDMISIRSHFGTVIESIQASGSDPDTGSGPWLDTQLDGKTLPPRPSVDIHAPRMWSYGMVLNNDSADRKGEHIAHCKSSLVMMRGTSALRNFILYGSGNDAIKGDGGPGPLNLTIENGHVFGLGLESGSHADGLQTRGNLQTLVLRRIFFDMPANEGNGTRSNACSINNTEQGPDGHILADQCIFHGGNFTLAAEDKGTGNALATWEFTACAFIVTRATSSYPTHPLTPRYGLWPRGNEARFTFDPLCGVYELLPNGVCTLITRDCANFDLQKWRLASL